MIFKLSYLNSNLALTLGYLNRALNNSAQGVTPCWILAASECLTVKGEVKDVETKSFCGRNQFKHTHYHDA